MSGWKIHTRTSRVDLVDAPTIVLVHGLGVSARYLMPTAQCLSNDFNLLLPELPGFGQSDKPDHVLDIPELADVLAAWLVVMGLPRAIFLGNSLGCQVIVELATRYPESVGHAILVGPTVDAKHRTFLRQLLHGFRDLMHEPWSLWRILIEDYLATGTRRMYQTCRYALADKVEQKVPSIRVPTLIVHGSLDCLAPDRWVYELAKRMADVKVVEIPGATHAANYTAPSALAESTRTFLQSRGA